MRGLSGGELVIHDEEAYLEIQRATEEWEREVDESMKEHDALFASKPNTNRLDNALHGPLSKYVP